MLREFFSEGKNVTKVTLCFSVRKRQNYAYCSVLDFHKGISNQRTHSLMELKTISQILDFGRSPVVIYRKGRSRSGSALSMSLSLVVITIFIVLVM